jgi:hypothetical protein
MTVMRCTCFVVLFLIVLFSVVVDASIGITPGLKRISFVPGLEETLHFSITSDSPESEVLVSLKGDLVEFATLSTNTLIGGGDVTVFLKLPQEIERPGKHDLLVRAEEDPGEGLVGVQAAVQARIEISVPFPGKYAEVEFEADDANAGEPVYFKLKVKSLGKNEIAAKPFIEIFDSNGKSLEVLNLEETLIASNDDEDFSASWDTSDYGAGNYKSTVNVFYGGEKAATAEDEFRLGKLFVDILNYSEEFERDKINPIDITVESFWNDLIEGVYVSGEVNKRRIQFQTPSFDLAPWEKRTIRAYFDTTTIDKDVDKFDGRLVVNYNGKITDREIELRFKKETNYLFIALVSGIVLAVILIIFLSLWILKLKRKNAKKKK